MKNETRIFISMICLWIGGFICGVAFGPMLLNLLK